MARRGQYFLSRRVRHLMHIVVVLVSVPFVKAGVARSHKQFLSTRHHDLGDLGSRARPGGRHSTGPPPFMRGGKGGGEETERKKCFRVW